MLVIDDICLIIVFLVGVKWYLTVILIFIHLKSNNVRHLLYV
jgi:hypothetical protein